MSQVQAKDVVPPEVLAQMDAESMRNLEMREKLAVFTAEKVRALPPLSDSLEEFHTEVPVRDGWLSRCKVVRPKSVDRPRPLIVDFFGGGFGAGDCDQLTVPARDFAMTYNAVVVLPSYRLTPEKRFPVHQQDGWDVVSYLSNHAETDERFLATLSPSAGGGFVVAGVSAGGTHPSLVAGIDLMLSTGTNVEHPDLQGLTPLPNKITGIFVDIAMLLFEPMVPPEYAALFTSRKDNADHPNFSTPECEETVQRLQITDWHSVWLSPFNSLKQLEKAGVAHQHPKVYVQSCHLDPLRDDTVIYEKYLREALGVSTRIDRFMDDGHSAWTALDFPSQSTNPTIPEATMAGMKWLLETKDS